MNVRGEVVAYEWNVAPGPSFDRSDNHRGTQGARAWDFIGCLKRRKVLILVVSALTLTLATAVLYAIPKTYTATSAVIFEGDRSDLVRVGGLSRETPFGPETLASEVELLQSEELLTKVVKRLDLVADPEFNPTLVKWSKFSIPNGAAAFVSPVLDPALQWGRQLVARVRPQEVAGPPIDPAQAALVATVIAVRRRLSVSPVGVSRVIHITFPSGRPDIAALVANTVASVYIDTLVEIKATATRQAHIWIEQRLSELRDRASQSAMAFEKFRYENDLGRGKDSTISQEQLTQISTELNQARERRAEVESVLAQTHGASVPELDLLASATGSQLLPRLREQLAQATARRAELGSLDGLQLPRVVANRAQVADIAHSITAERDRIRQTLESKAVVAKLAEERLSNTLEGLKARLGKSQGDFARMETLANADRELYKSFVDRYRQTDPEVDYQAASARVLSHAAVPLWPSFPNKSLLLPFSLAVSLGLGTVIAVAKENACRGLQSMDDVQTTVGQTPLGLLPFVSRNDTALLRIFEEAVAHVLARVMMPTTASVPHSILVTSALPLEGKTKTAIALAAAATETGMKVLLVDADLRSRSLSAAAGLDRSDKSLVRLLRREITADEAVHFSPAWGFSVLPAGSLDGSPMGLLATGTWESTLRTLEKKYDLVLIDSPPVLVAGDTWILARAPESTVVLSRWRSTPLPTLELAITQLGTAQARLAGVVLTMVEPREHASYRFGDSVVFSPELMRYSDGHGRLSAGDRASYPKAPSA